LSTFEGALMGFSIGALFWGVGWIALFLYTIDMWCCSTKK
jgi:hypothetical protein